MGAAQKQKLLDTLVCEHMAVKWDAAYCNHGDLAAAMVNQVKKNAAGVLVSQQMLAAVMPLPIAGMTEATKRAFFPAPNRTRT